MATAANSAAAPRIEWDGAPVRQRFGDCLIVADGVATLADGRTFRVNASANRHGKRAEVTLRHLSAAKRGHVVPESQMTAVRDAATAAAAELFAALIRAEREPATAVAETPAAPLRLRAAPPAPAPVRVVDVTPTWAAILPLLRAAAEDGTPEGKRIAWEELARMADAADKWNASVSAN